MDISHMILTNRPLTRDDLIDMFGLEWGDYVEYLHFDCDCFAG